MKGGDISNVSSPQVIVVTDVVVQLAFEEERRLLSRKSTARVGAIELLPLNTLWRTSNDYGLSLELAGFADQGWTEELLESALEKFERRAANPFNYPQLYESVDELVGLLPYRPNLRGVVDIPSRVAHYGSAGVEIARL